MNRGIEQYHDTDFKEKQLQSESGVSIRDLEGNEYPLQATITYDKELNGNQSILFHVLPSKVNTFIHDITEMWEVVADTDYKVIYCKKRGTGDKLSVEIKAIPVFFDTFDTQRIYEEYNEHMTAQLCFNRIFQDSGYNVVLNGAFNAIQWEGFGAGDTRLTLFKNALNRYKAEFTVSGNTVTIENLIGRDTQFMYRYKLNASNIVQENDATSYWTYAKGYGDFAEGEWQDAKLIREYTSPIASIIGKREAPPIKNGNITTAETMDEQLKTLVDDSLKISVSADIHDLKKYPLAQPMVGDRAFLMDERIGLETEIRIQHLSITKDWKGNVLNLQAQFGSPNIVKRHQSNLQTAIGNITNLLEGKIKLPFSVLDNAVAEATKALQNAQTELQFPESGGILSVDKNDPNLITLLNSAGFGVSEDGGGTFGQAITGRGINASYIYAGHINSNVVTIGNNKVALNNNGVFVYKNGIEGASLVEGNLTFNDQSNGQRIGRFAATVWSDNVTKGISMNMEQNRFISFGHYVDQETGYTPMMLLNPSTNMAGNVQGIHMNLPIRTNRDVWMGTNALRFGENNNHNHSALWHGEQDSLVLGSYTGIRLSYLTTGGVINDRLTVDSNSVDIWQDLDMHGWKILRVAEVDTSSSITTKTNIEDLSMSGLDVINNLEVKQYLFQRDVDLGNYSNRQVGVMSELSPEIATLDGKSVILNKWVGYLTHAVQEEYQARKQLEQRVADLELIVGGM